MTAAMVRFASFARRAPAATRLLALAACVSGVRPDLCGGDAPAEEPDMKDNSFFIEEAYNQEPGVIQHIVNGVWSRFVQEGRRESSIELSFTQEWPVPNMTHQLSYTVPYAWLLEDQDRAHGIGDVLLNYRYQALEETDAQPAFAPRFSLALPTGDVDDGLGLGEVGYQFNLPLSKKIGERFYIHLNAGMALTPNVQASLVGGGKSDRELLIDYRFGFSVIYLLRPDFNVLVEVFPTRVEGIDTETGRKEETREMVVSPGVRYAINFRRGAQMVLGAAVPLGLTSESDDYGVFLYFSFEHRLWGGDEPKASER